MKKYNNADTTLAWDLQASWMSFVVKTGEWALFPSSWFPYDVIIEHYEWTVVRKRENISIWNKTWDAFSIAARHSQTCVQDDFPDSWIKTRTADALSFTSWDRIFMSFTEGDMNEIETEIYSNIPADLDLKVDKTVYNAEKEVYASSSTGNDSYAITSPTVTSYVSWQTFKVLADIWNTGTATLQLNALSPKTIKKLVNGAFVVLDTGDIVTNQIFWATYNPIEDCFQFSVDPATAPIVQVESTVKSFVAWENITDWNALYINPADWKVYKTDSSNSSKINFVWFATETVLTNASIKIDTSWISNTQDSLTIWSAYYLWESYYNIVNSSQVLVNATWYDANPEGRIWYDTSYQRAWQSFTLSTDKILRNISVRIKKNWAPTNVVSMKLYASDRATLIATSSTTYNGASITGTFAPYVFDFSDIILTASTQYFISIEASSNNTTNYYTLEWSTVSVYGWWQAFQGSSTIRSAQTIDFYVLAQMWTWTIRNISTIPWANSAYVWNAINTTSILLNIDQIKQLAVITPTVWASPYTYQNTTGRQIKVSITGGTVSAVAYSRDNTNYYQTSAWTNTFVILGVNDYVRITYTVAPTVKVFTF